MDAPSQLVAQCHATAHKVGYAVPCPTRIPAGLSATPGTADCSLEIIGAAGEGGCSHLWRGWIFGSSNVLEQHLVITGAPTELKDATKVVNGPIWRDICPCRVRPIRSLRINGWKIQAVFVPPAANEGSAFAGHVVMIWTVSGHTYGAGFHDLDGVRQTLRRDEELVRAMKLVSQ